MRVKLVLAQTAKSPTETAIVNALPAKSMTARAVVKLLAPIRRNRIAKTVFPTAAAVPKTATGAIPARLVTEAVMS